MLRIKLPATTANLAVGFDCLGMALDLYNTFEFVKADSFNLFGFEPSNKENLVLKTYSDFSKRFQKTVVPVEVHLINNDVPISRGLGSSATCILAGVLAANYFNELNLSFDECVKYAAQIEGHPDNVFACAYGGMVSVIKDDSNYIYNRITINSNLKFYILVPRVLGDTSILRELLPKEIIMEDAVYNLSRALVLPKAIETGDFDLLKVVLKDRLHQPYRLHHIPMYNDFQEINLTSDIISLISGSGPSVFVISKSDDALDQLQKFKQEFNIIKTSVGMKVQMEELL
jgi:homoserine kinase